MANPAISFAILENANALGAGGSGLGFYGNGFGTSVALGEYQTKTFMTSSDGQAQGPAAKNIKCIKSIAVNGDVVPQSGIVEAVSPFPSKLVYINGSEATLTIKFTNDSPVKVQNAQLRIYDRNNSINNPASGVNTKVCEIVNFDGKSYQTWYTDAGNDDTSGDSVAGSGDALWWGSAWPSGYMYVDTGRPYYENSVGVKFYNFTDYEFVQGTGNRDSRLAGIAGATATVGGTGIIVPLFDSPGSGGQNLISTGVYPKFIQYIKPASQSLFGMGGTTRDGTGAYKPYTYGATGVSAEHVWRVGLSASPYSIGSKTDYGLYISLEYLS